MLFKLGDFLFEHLVIILPLLVICLHFFVANDTGILFKYLAYLVNVVSLLLQLGQLALLFHQVSIKL